jgi:hypothetical protein
MSAYGASKGAAASFTYAWSAEMKEFNIRVNALSPMAATRMADASAAYMASKGLKKASNVSGPPAEANAPVVVYLLSDLAKDVTGQIVRIEGKELSLVSHPGVALPILERSAGWDIASVADAFTRELGKRQFPTGVVGLNVQPAPMVKKTWD